MNCDFLRLTFCYDPEHLANLAVGLARKGHSVGLVDGDIYGPSVPTLMGLEHDETTIHENQLQPFAAHGVKAMTMGKLVEARTQQERDVAD